MIRIEKLRSTETVQSQIKWYEGIAYYLCDRNEHVIAIIPLNIILRLTRSFYYWLKIGK